MTQGACLNAPPDVAPWTRPRLNAIPGTALTGPDDWIMVSETHAEQMALRDQLVGERPGEVLGALAGAEPAIDELFAVLCATLSRRPDYQETAGSIRRPDGVAVPLDGPRLATMARLVQEDLCLMEQRGAEYVLTAATLCFPASWLLSEKLGHGMTRIHAPVDRYDDQAATRVARLFDGLKPGLPIVRENGLRTHQGELFAPQSEASHHAPGQPPRDTGRYWRSERQCLVRLPETRAVLFSIHTRLWSMAALEA